MTFVLAIDTASPVLAVAFANEATMLREEALEAAQDHSRALLPAIERVLSGQTPDLVVVASGPGSYAGLRVGIATAEGLSLSFGAPVVGIPTLEAVAEAVGGGRVVAIHPAGRGEFACQEFVGGEPLGPPTIADPLSLTDGSIAGEGAAAFGGREVSSAERCHAAVRLALAPERRTDAVVPIYVREPAITRPRRALSGAGA